ncbi:MAG: DUF5961 family protein [Caulobacteraceae bacterium]
MKTAPTRRTVGDRAAARSFSAHCSNAGEHRSDFVTDAASFEEAAMALVERWAGPEGECRVIVTDRQTGERHGFSLHLGGGPTP